MQWAKKQSGFTIVELLIVVVVIAILAALTIVAFNGINERAKNSAAQSATSQAYKKILAYFVENAENYPTDLDAIGLQSGGGTSYQYSYNNSSNPRTFCVTVTAQSISYYQNNDSAPKPVAGACPGHGVNGLPPNLAANPSFETAAAAIPVRTNLTANPTFETNVTGWGAVNGGTGAAIAQSTTQAHTGTNSLRYTYGDGSTPDSGPGGGITASSGVTYTISAWVYAPTSIASGLKMLAYNTAAGNTIRGSTVTTVGSWARVSVSLTTVAAGTLSFAVGKEGTSTDTGKLLYVDSVLVEATTIAMPFFSGVTAATGDYTYGWTGTAHASSSQELAANVANYSQNGSGSVRFMSDVRASAGSNSARVQIITNSMNAGLYQGIALPAGTYTFIAKVWIESGAGMSVGLTSQGTSVTTGAIAGYPSSTTTQGQWVELRRSIIVPTTTTVNSFAYILGAFNTAGTSFWVDEYAVVEGECTTAVCY